VPATYEPRLLIIFRCDAVVPSVLSSVSLSSLHLQRDIHPSPWNRWIIEDVAYIHVMALASHAAIDSLLLDSTTSAQLSPVHLAGVITNLNLRLSKTTQSLDTTQEAGTVQKIPTTPQCQIARKDRTSQRARTDHSLQDSTVASLIGLLIASCISRNYDFARTHLKGLQSIFLLRGGLEGFADSPHMIVGMAK
jgi:hypothetical protein